MKRAGQAFTPRAFVMGALGSLTIAVGDPYATMVIRGSYMALDFSTPGALFLLLLLAGLFNPLLKRLAPAWALAPGELLVIYIMMITASAVSTMGLVAYMLPLLTSPFYFATPENNWENLIQPHVPAWMVPQGTEVVKWFYEGAPLGRGVPWGAWIPPLLHWAVLLVALYAVMICAMVLLRRQWVEHERLLYPVAQVPLEIVREEPGHHLPPFFRNPVMWAGFALPVIAGTLKALHAYYSFMPAAELVAVLPFFRNTVNLIFRLSFPVIGFTYLINLDIAFSLWFFNLLAHLFQGVMNVLGIGSTEKLAPYGAWEKPILAHQATGAMAVLVIMGLWVARPHLAAVWRQALSNAAAEPGELFSYRAALLGLVGGLGVMALWLWWAGMPLWVVLLLVLIALLVFVGLTRVVVEAGMAEAMTPLIATAILVSGLGSTVLGPAAMVNLGFTYVWQGDLRTFLMASCAHGLKLGEHLGQRLRPLLWAMGLALLLGLVASTITLLHLAYQYGGINLNAWFFGAGCQMPFEFIADKLNTPTGPNWGGWAHTAAGALVMGLLMLARHQWPWWPLHPLGYPMAVTFINNQIWLSIFIAWLLKLAVVKYGGPQLYHHTRPFFLGLIAGQFAIAGLWLVIDFFTGMTDNVVFWI
ncbi:MAG: hypothetical protein EXS58_06895 [Candidatus Latescibacteria bacterium]|nr:hypothetical protein [Candidatus Latescibacterota bacterium]